MKTSYEIWKRVIRLKFRKIPQKNCFTKGKNPKTMNKLYGWKTAKEAKQKLVGRWKNAEE